jgi:glycosyltransferase involved in cell wall biosynthesis
VSLIRVGIYNRWLATLGGGERHSLAIAEYLSRTCQVEIITHRPVSSDLAASRFNLDLSRVRFTTIPDRSSLEISPLTSAYDLFINASHLDFFPSYAGQSIQLVYFPSKLSWQKVRARQFKMALRRWLKLPSILVGSQAFQTDGGDFSWKADVHLRVRLPSSINPYRIKFFLRSLRETVRCASLMLDGVWLEQITFPISGQPVVCDMDIPATEVEEWRELSISVEGDLQPDGAPTLQISNLWLDLPQYRLYHTVFERGLRGVALRLQYYPPGSALLEYLDTYRQIWANSEFTHGWIKTYWQRNSQVLYPPVDTGDFYCAEKKNRIISVGRFFAGQHNKKHLTMIQVFKSMVDAGLQGWELHLVGGRMSGAEHDQYYTEICNAARGYPVVFHPDVPFDGLVELYAGSAIYWHASGYGENEKKYPDKMEHFGITTVEAMASGCVPVVIARGGQPEIVEPGGNGYLWRSREQLADFTFQLIRDPLLREKLSCQGLVDSRKFDVHQFQSRLQDLLQYTGIF